MPSESRSAIQRFFLYIFVKSQIDLAFVLALVNRVLSMSGRSHFRQNWPTVGGCLSLEEVIILGPKGPVSTLGCV
jgi:hypothetical protein